VTDTDPQHRIRLAERCQASVIGGRPYTTSSFVLDDQYLALARVQLTNEGRFIVTHEDY
jgi:hypothetical protein